MQHGLTLRRASASLRKKGLAMKTILFALGALQIIGGALFAIEAASAIHQILAAVTFGLGTVCLGIAVLVDRVEKLQKQPSPVTPETVMDITGKKSGGWKQA